MSTAIGQWNVEIDDALAADFDGSLSGLGIELGTASFNMSEALMALPSLSSLKHNTNHHHHNHSNQHDHHPHHHQNHHHHHQHHGHHHSSNENDNDNSNGQNISNNNSSSNNNNSSSSNSGVVVGTTQPQSSSSSSSHNNFILTSSLAASLRLQQQQQQNHHHHQQHQHQQQQQQHQHHQQQQQQQQHHHNHNNNHQHGLHHHSNHGDHNHLATSLLDHRSNNNGNNNPNNDNQQQHGQQHITNGNNHSNTNNNNNSNNGNNQEEKPVAVVHGKKNRLAAYGHDADDVVQSTTIKRFCLNSDRNNSEPNNDHHSHNHGHHHHHHHNHHHQDGLQPPSDCELSTSVRHGSSASDLRSNNLSIANSGNGGDVSAAGGGNESYSPTLQIASQSTASSPSSSTSISTPSTTFFSHIISASQCLSNSNNNGGQDNNVSSGTGSSSSSLAHIDHRSTNVSTTNASTSAVSSKSNEPSKFQYVLGASTSMAIKMNEETMTYLNQGQSYEIKLKKVGDLSEMKGKMLKTIIRVCFHDRRLQYIEKELIEQWKEQRPSERVIEIDVPLSYGIQDVRNDLKYINRSEFFWDPTKETGVFIRINCISTEFTPKKHGGEKGVPFRILIETYSKDDPTHCLHAASCQVKVFKPKGADRKHKTDREKMNRKPVTEQEKFQPSYDCTVFTDCSLDAFALYNLSSNSNMMIGSDILHNLSKSIDSDEYLNLMETIHKSKILSPMPKPVGPASPNISNIVVDKTPSSANNSICHLLSDISDNSYEFSFSAFPTTSSTTLPSPLSSPKQMLTSTATWDETQKWLKDNRFDAYLSMFENFSGFDFLMLSKEDLIQICGLTDGIRLYNALHWKSIKSKLSIYVCSHNDELFRAIYLDTLTVNELQSKLIATMLSSNSTNPKCTYLKRFCMMGPSAVKILITDDVVRNLQDESLYLIEFTKDYKGEYHGLMKPYNNQMTTLINNNNGNIHC
ncbi:uncharacterized protein LOC124491103 isoform X2 [Dermatophagoides farinae]|uniref:uncharacterized protein LOC124491103 isoform X2 n=1 Tax=Dermatophagoides farinae TaxID=6954 RepID=UPI003F5ECB86